MTNVLVVAGVVAGVMLLAVLLVGLAGLTDRLSAAVFSKSRILAGIALGGLVLLTVGYLLDRPSYLWIGAGTLALLTLFLLAAN